MLQEFPEEVVLVRHAQSWTNKLKAHSPIFFHNDAARSLIAGIPDHKIDLTPEGVRQAIVTGVAMEGKGFVFDYAYHTGYLRTKRSQKLQLDAYPEEERKKIRIQCNIFLREREPGFTYNITSMEAEQYFPWLQEYWKTHGPVFARPPGGESIADVVQRVYLGRKDIYRETAGKQIRIDLHGRTLAAWRFIEEDWDYEQLEAFVQKGDHKNCGVTVYRYSKEENKMILKEYNTCYWE
jgi:broad specificity phosphatase PhoE